MAEPDSTHTPRKFSRTDLKRSVIALVIFGLVGGGYWLLMPVLQSLVLPKAPGGEDGPWVVRPIQAFHFGATAVLSALTVPLILGPFGRRWKKEDAASGTRFDPFHDRPGSRVGYMLKGSLLVLVYAVGLIFYLSSWETIGPDGIGQHLPWTTRRHVFQDIAGLETIPEGERSDAIQENGPWYEIKFRSGPSVTLGLDNEGITPGELASMTRFIGERSGLPWMKRGDSRAR